MSPHRRPPRAVRARFGAISTKDTRYAALQVARAAARAWRQAAIPEAEDGVCLGTVAALSLLPRHLDAGECAKRLLGASDERIADLLDDLWCRFTIARPELAFRCEPFCRWLGEAPRDEATIAAAAQVARAALEAGLLGTVLDRDRGIEADVLGDLRLALRDMKARQAHGEFHTPPGVTDAMGAIAIGDLEPGEAIRDPWAGTGAMLRAAAAVLREGGRDPHEYRWLACDIDPVAVGALAVNAHIWDLGPHVLLGCADSIAEPAWHARAAEEQGEAAREQWLREVAVAVFAATEATER